MICIFLSLGDCGLLLLVGFYLILDPTISYSGFLQMLHLVHPCSILHQIGIWFIDKFQDVKTCSLQVMPLISNDFNDETARSSKCFEDSRSARPAWLRCPARRWRRIWSSGRPEVQWTTWMGSTWSSPSASWRSPRSCIDQLYVNVTSHRVESSRDAKRFNGRSMS